MILSENKRKVTSARLYNNQSNKNETEKIQHGKHKCKWNKFSNIFWFTKVFDDFFLFWWSNFCIFRFSVIFNLLTKSSSFPDFEEKRAKCEYVLILHWCDLTCCFLWNHQEQFFDFCFFFFYIFWANIVCFTQENERKWWRKKECVKKKMVINSHSRTYHNSFWYFFFIRCFSVSRMHVLTDRLFHLQHFSLFFFTFYLLTFCSFWIFSLL